MPQIINAGPGAGARLGEALGAGIGTGLSQLAERKLADITERNQAKSRFGNLFGDQETAQWVNSLRPQDQLAAIQWLTSQGGAQAQPQAAQQIAQNFQPVQQNVQQLATEKQPLYGNSEQSAFLKQLGGMPQRQQFQQQPLPQNLVQQRNLADQLKQQQEGQALAQRAQVKQAQQQQMAQQQQQLQQQPAKPTLRAALAAGPQQGAVRAPQEVKLNKTQEGYVKGYDTAQESVGILDRMQELLDSGKVNNGLLGNAPLSLQNAESQEFAQLGDTLAGLLVSQYGTPTNAKIKFTQGQKPQLTQAKEVQKRGIDRLRKDALERQKIARDRLPAGYFGEEQEQQQQAPQQREVAKQEAVENPQEKERESVATKVLESSPDNMNWFARKAKEEAASEAKGTPKEEGWFDWFTRNVQRGKTKAGEALFGKGDIEKGFKEFEDLTGGKHKFTPEQKNAIRRIQHKSDFLNDPQNFSEQVSDRMFESLPLIGLTGIKGAANVGNALLADLGSSVASTAAEKAGGGAGAQFIASLAGGSSARKLTNYFNKGKSFKDLTSIAKDAESKAYKQSRDLGKNINIEGRDYKKKITDVAEELMESSALDYADKEETLRKFNQWVGDVQNNKINADKILSRKQDINAAYRNSPPNAKPFLAKAKAVMTDQLDKIGKSHHEFDAAWKRGDLLHGALKYPEQFEQTLAEIPKVGKYLKNPIAYALVAGAGGLLKGNPLEAAGKGLLAGIGGAGSVKGLETYWPKIKNMSKFAMAQDPKVREIALDAIRNVIENNKGSLQRSLIKLSKATQPYSELI